MKKLLLGIAAGALLAPLANAANFDFTGKGSAAAAANQTVGGITVTVTQEMGGNFGLGYLNLDGLGVKRTSGCCGGILDGIQNNQTIKVSFSGLVNFGSITFRQWEGPDKIQLVSAGGNLTLDAETSAGSAETFDLSSLGAIDSFTLTGDSIGTVAFLAGLNDVQEVPLPAAAWLFGSAVLGLGGMARRKRMRKQ